MKRRLSVEVMAAREKLLNPVIIAVAGSCSSSRGDQAQARLSRLSYAPYRNTRPRASYLYVRRREEQRLIRREQSPPRFGGWPRLALE